MYLQTSDKYVTKDEPMLYSFVQEPVLSMCGRTIKTNDLDLYNVKDRWKQWTIPNMFLSQNKKSNTCLTKFLKAHNFLKLFGIIGEEIGNILKEAKGKKKKKLL